MIAPENEKIPEDEISLANGQIDKEYQVVSVAGGCGVQMRLASLGILPGQKLRLIKTSKAGPIMISVKGSKIALGRGIISKIIVRENGHTDNHIDNNNNNKSNKK